MKTKLLKCSSCGAVVEAIVNCDCACGIQCCDSRMTELTPKTADSAKEKHVPVPKNEAGGCRVTVGSTPHPMTPEHHIVFIEIVDGETVTRRYLEPTGAPEAVFSIAIKPGMTVREYCNLHGLWEYKVQE